MMSSPNYDHLAHLKIPLENVLTATNNFADEHMITEDSYQGQLLLSGELINILALRLKKQRDDKDEQQFWMDVSMLSSLRHENLVSFVGFCDENEEKIGIYKMEFTGTLRDYLSDSLLLTWVRRLEICVGVAHALSYIHYDESRDFSVIHHNIESSAILLNDDWEAKLCDFTHSMKIKASERHRSFDTDEVLTTDGYTDPTYIQTKSVNHKSDMYSFGIVLCEVLCGRDTIINDDYNKYLAPMVITHYREKKLSEIIDWDLLKQMDSQSLNILAEIAYDCLNEERSKRPNIDEIVPRLEKALELARENRPMMSSPKDDLAHLKIPLESILSATNNFAEENLISISKFCNEYKGQLLWSGDLIDICARRLNKERIKEQDFWMEISMLSSLKHKNLVSIVGFCDENDDKIIINKNATTGWLETYLSDSTLMTWIRRLEICVGLAHALSYIHHDELRDFSVIHRGISSATVTLDDKWEPKLSDLEGSMNIEASQRHHSFHSNTPVYMVGYGDPTYIETKNVNHKSDIYSFGIVLFELLCGRKSIIDDNDDNHLAPLVITHYREKKLDNIIDKDLWKQMDLQSFNVFAELAYECLDEERSRRPNIVDIVPRLEKALELARKNSPTVRTQQRENMDIAIVRLEQSKRACTRMLKDKMKSFWAKRKLFK